MIKKKDRVLALRAAGVSYGQIAEQLDCDVGYVSATIQRAKHGGARPADIRCAERYEAKVKTALRQLKRTG